MPKDDRSAVERARRNAQSSFAKPTKVVDEAAKERDAQRAAVSAKIDRLRALRLAKEAADREAAAAAPPAPPKRSKARRPAST